MIAVVWSWLATGSLLAAGALALYAIKAWGPDDPPPPFTLRDGDRGEEL